MRHPHPELAMKPLAAAVYAALTFAMTGITHAQQAPSTPAAASPAAKKDEKKEVEKIDKVEVTGIRASLEKSIAVKREAETNIEVVTAEDVGKMPDKNIADALSRLSGVNVQFGGALAMDEAERVSIRGTSPNLNLVTVNGHALSSGDWHVGDQGSSGRSVGFGLMPSQLIGRSIVYKTGQADITEGGIAGTVDIQTRKPLDFRKSFTAEVALGAVYATLPKKTDPQVSGLLNWKNDDGTFGVLVQGFREDRHLRRDGQETFGFNVITAAQATASGNANLAGKRIPGSLNSALFEGVREREGGYVGVQFKPNRMWDIGFSAFRATLQADNYNSSAFALPFTLLNNGYVIRNARIEGDVVVSADIVRPTTLNANTQVPGFQFDHNVRQGAKSLSSFYDFDVTFRPTDKISVRGRAGYTEGSGVTNSQPSLTFVVVNPNVSYTINTDRPTDYRLTNGFTGAPINLGTTASYVQVSNTGASVKSSDEETYWHLDGEYRLNIGPITNVKFGGRGAKHERQYDVIGARWNAQDGPTGPITPSPFISIPGFSVVTNIVPTSQIPVPATAYPSNYASGLNATFPRELFRFDSGQIRDFANRYVNWNTPDARILTSGYTVEEENSALYLMGEFDADRLTGNFGVRPTNTKVRSLSYQALPNGTGVGQCVPLQPCNVPGAIVGSRFATYLPQVVETDHSTVLPSLNLRYAAPNNVIIRGSASRTIGRPNYNELAGAVALNNTLLTGSSGNPLLKPITSNNLDASVAWYFGRRAYVSASVFQQELKNYVKAGTSQVEFFNTNTGTNSLYTVTSRIGANAKLKGIEAALEMPIAAGFGIITNYTYVDGKDQDGVKLLGTSKNTFNLIGYYEDDKFSARLAYNYRDDYAIGFVGNGTNTPTNGVHMYKGYGGVALSMSYKIYKDVSITFDGNNLTDPVRSTYYITENAPGYWHKSGRQYFVNVRAKF